ncbi:unnamed protein product [Mytilus coruscus]|uniref:Integrase zinc-binding domain-containing protein n=1 Tax=Mytilus coruscus TaxID=42192 RepID=A0A6J8A7S7_MYTCO|nr:unnamed protein product [Mytilus coruscus]
MSPATESIEYSLYYLLFGKEMNLPFDVDVQPKDNMGKKAKEHIQEVIEKLKIAKEIATDNVNRRQEKNKEHYDKKAKEPDFRVGRKVLIQVYKVPPGLSRKLQDKSDGPYLITQLGPNHTYRLMNCNIRKVMKSLINAQHFRIYHDPRLFRRQDDIIVTPQINDEENVDHQPNADNAETVNNEIDKEIVDETTYEVEFTWKENNERSCSLQMQMERWINSNLGTNR